MRVFASHLQESGGLRKGLTVETAGDIVYAMNSAEFFMLLVHERGWDAASFERWVADAFKRLLLPD